MTSRDQRSSVLCVGDLVADIVSSSVDRLPQPGELKLTKSIAVHPGGNALNAAIALKRLGENVAIAGSLGDDALGDLLLDRVRDCGLDVSGVRRESGRTTASTLILRARSEDRRFLHALGVAADFTGEYISDELVPRRGVVLVGGYLKLAAWADERLGNLLRLAQKQGCHVVFSVCVPAGSSVDPKRCLGLLNHVDVFVLNEDEARVITDATAPSTQAKFLRRAGAKVVVITRGPLGLYAESGDRVVNMGAYRVPLVDPSGCGDCFSAGLVAALLREWDIERALECGSAVGALGATALGCTSGVPSFCEVERFLAANKPQPCRRT